MKMRLNEEIYRRFWNEIVRRPDYRVMEWDNDWLDEAVKNRFRKKIRNILNDNTEG